MISIENYLIIISVCYVDSYFLDFVTDEIIFSIQNFGTKASEIIYALLKEELQT